MPTAWESYDIDSELFWPAEIDTVVRLKSGLQKSGLYRFLLKKACPIIRSKILS